MSARATAPVLISAALLLFSGCRLASKPVDQVVLVTLDTTRADHLGCYGRKDAETPTLDGLAKEAVLFEEAESAVPITMPSHSTMMTGLNPYHHGVRYNLIHVLPKSVTTVAERLKAVGFDTGAVPSAMVVASRFGLNQGFDYYPDDFPKPTGPDAIAERTATDAVDLAIRWWNGHAGKKRFLWLHLYSPHTPYAPPFPYSSRFAGRLYEGEIAYMDHELGRFFADLRAQGDWSRTLLIVAGDHGEGLYEHGERWHGPLVYESTLHVPLLVKVPGLRGGTRVTGPVGLVDITPTILDYVGIKTSDPMDGPSLRGALETGKAPLRDIYFESTETAINYGWSPLYGVRRGSMKYFEGARPELYDLATDPHEANNLASQNTRRAADMHAELEPFLKAAKASDPTAAAAPLDDETMAQLASLGYVGGPSSKLPEHGKGVHPPDMVGLEQEMLRSQSAFGAKRWDYAADSLDFILKKDPTNRLALYERARVFARTHDLDKALKTAEVLRRLAPDSTFAVDLVGELLSGMGRPAEAAKVYEAALDKNPKDAQLRYHRILVEIDAGDLSGAATDLKVLERERPGHYSTPMAQALLEAARGQTQAAIGSLRHAIVLGLKSLTPVENSPYFKTVRNDPAYRALAEKLESSAAASSAAADSIP